MRIIGGKYGGRKFFPPVHIPARPTTDMAKEGLFNIIENNLDITSLKTLDIFAGTGSISYELASRGAKELTLVEQDKTTTDFIRNTIELFHFTNCKVIKMEVFKFLHQCDEKFDFIFAGPPYALATIDEIPELIFEKKLLLPGGWLVLEHTPRNDYSHLSSFSTQRNYGTTVFSIFVNRNIAS